MNLLEQYIRRIHSVKKVSVSWRDEPIIVADLTTESYGRIERVEKGFLDWEEWKLAMRQGFYMA